MSIKQDRTLYKINPIVAREFTRALNECNKLGYNMAITESFRTVERQDWLYAQGRTRKGNIVTYATGKEKESYHMWGLAIDIHHNVKGHEYDADWFEKSAKIFKKYGFEWGGDFTKFVDRPHFQMTFGLTINELKQGAKPPVNDKLQIEVHRGSYKETLECEFINKGGNNFVRLRDIQNEYLEVDFINGKPVIRMRE